MPEQQQEQLGALMQAYARARWGRKPDEIMAAELGARLDVELRDRIDVLGFDGERLLDVEPSAVFTELERLERLADQEDARVVGAAERAQARAEKGQTKAAANPGRNGSTQPAGQPRPAGGQGRRGKKRRPRSA